MFQYCDSSVLPDYLVFYFGYFCCLKVISIFPYVYVLLLVTQYDFSDFSKVCCIYFSKIFYRLVYKNSLPCILMARRPYYFYCKSVAESLRHIKINILLSIRRTVISKFIMIFLM
jgi:hypothetical protein